MLKLKTGFTGERCITLPDMIIEMEKTDPLASSLYITDIGYFPNAEHHYREREKSISQHVLIYCVEGTGWYQIGDGPQRKVVANQYFILPANQPHRYASSDDDPWTIYWIHFSGEHAEIYAEGASVPQSITPAINSRINDRNQLFEDIYHALGSGLSIENLRYASSLLHYYLASIRYLSLFRNNNSAEEGTSSPSDNDIVKAAIHFMNENIEKKLTLSDISAFTGYSGSHISMIFKKNTGHSPLNYFNYQKMRYAARLLTTTDMHINQICFKVGIEDNYYFSRLFSKNMGKSPKEYRKEHCDTML